MNETNLINKLSDISIQISYEKNVDKLLQIILENCIEITDSDAGSIYTVEANQLHFEYTVNHSVDFPFKKFIIPVNNQSISGNCVLNKETYNLRSMEDTQELLGIKHNDSFDKSIGYKTINMLVIPMQNYKGEIIGVMQLINKKADANLIITSATTIDLPEYTKQDEQITNSLASQAAILIERTRLQEDITNLLDSMIDTLSTALDQRDPVTAGHSKRVAEFSMSLAKAINANEDTYSEIVFDEDHLKELHIAALLHDVGKIGIPESVLQKKNRLTVDKTKEIISRFYLIGEILSNRKEKSFYFGENIDKTISKIVSISESNFLQDEDKLFLKNLKGHSDIDYKNIVIKILSDDEYHNLCVLKGNLTNEERNQINQHARYSKEILDTITWGKTLSNVPDLASKHHEKLNGKGYPYGFNENKLSIIDRIMPIVDVYDALTAKDRPYKPAMSKDKACEILIFEVKNGSLDKSLVDLFIEKVINLGGETDEN